MECASLCTCDEFSRYGVATINLINGLNTKLAGQQHNEKLVASTKIKDFWPTNWIPKSRCGNKSSTNIIESKMKTGKMDWSVCRVWIVILGVRTIIMLIMLLKTTHMKCTRQIYSVTSAFTLQNLDQFA